MYETEEFTTHIYIKISAALWKYLPPFFLVWGTFSNILSFIVFTTKAMRASLTSFLFRVLSVIDLSMLYSHAWATTLLFIFDIDTFTLNDISCRTFAFWMNFSKICAAWILVLIGFERLISVCIPHKVKLICTKVKAIIALFIICLVSLAIQLPSIFTVKQEIWFDSEGNALQQVCSLSLTGSDGLLYYTDYIWPWVDFLMYTGIPFILMMSFNIVIITKLSIAAVKRSRSTTRDSENRSSLSSLTGMLLSVSFAFLVLTIPMTINYFPTKMSEESLYLVHVLSYMCIYTNHSSNFLFYCIGGSRFRQVLKDMFACSNTQGLF